jgi:hypothetical protein
MPYFVSHSLSSLIGWQPFLSPVVGKPRSQYSPVNDKLLELELIELELELIGELLDLLLLLELLRAVLELLGCCCTELELGASKLELELELEPLLELESSLSLKELEEL